MNIFGKSEIRAESLITVVTKSRWLVGIEIFQITHNLRFTHNFREIPENGVPNVFVIPEKLQLTSTEGRNMQTCLFLCHRDQNNRVLDDC